MLKNKSGTLYKLTSDNAVIERVDSRVVLELSKGHYYNETSAKDGVVMRRKVITAKGFDVIANITGTSFIRPPTVLDEQGMETGNPIVRYDEDGCIDRVRVRELAVGRAMNGTLRAVDLTLTYSNSSHLADLLFSLFVDNGYPEWGFVCNRHFAQKSLEESRKRGGVSIGGGNWLVYDLTAKEVRTALKEYSQMAPMADRTAATFVRRNLMRSLTGMVYAEDDGSVCVSSWPQADVNWEDVDCDNLSGYEYVKAEEDAQAGEVTAESTGTRGLDSQLKDAVRAVGDWRQCRDMCKHHLDQWGIKWGDITSQPDERIVTIINTLAEAKDA